MLPLCCQELLIDQEGWRNQVGKLHTAPRTF